MGVAIGGFKRRISSWFSIAKRWQQIAAGVSPQRNRRIIGEPRSGGRQLLVSLTNLPPLRGSIIGASIFRGLTPTAICWRRFATQTIRVESFEVLLGGGVEVFDGPGGGIEFGLRGVPFE